MDVFLEELPIFVPLHYRFTRLLLVLELYHLCQDLETNDPELRLNIRFYIANFDEGFNQVVWVDRILALESRLRPLIDFNDAVDQIGKLVGQLLLEHVRSETGLKVCLEFLSRRQVGHSNEHLGTSGFFDALSITLDLPVLVQSLVLETFSDELLELWNRLQRLEELPSILKVDVLLAEGD